MRIPGRFNGPPGAGHGGFVAGRLSAELGESGADVWLRAPVPLDTDLELGVAEGRARLMDGQLLLAEAGPATMRPDPVPFVGFERAQSAMADYPGAESGPYAECFGCGRDRPDGLRVFPGPLGEGLSACVWHPRGRRAEEWLWTALDCGSGWAWPLHEELMVTGRLHGRVLVPAEDLDPADPLVLVSAQMGSSGRKHESAACLFTRTGLPVAAVRATWLSLGVA